MDDGSLTGGGSVGGEGVLGEVVLVFQEIWGGKGVRSGEERGLEVVTGVEFRYEVLMILRCPNI